jgi:Flp pilus assembly protein TadG
MKLNTFSPPGTETARYLNVFLKAHADRLRAALADRDRGASAVELAVITAVLVGLAVAILVIVVDFANKQGTAIKGTNVPNPAGGG